MEKIEEIRDPIWDNDLIMCPSQCYCYFELMEKINELVDEINRLKKKLKEESI